MSKKKQCGIYLSNDVLNRLKHYCVDKNSTISDVIEQATIKHLNEVDDKNDEE